MEFQDRVVLITGASSGIGRALAKVLAGRGAKVALLARRREELEKLAMDISAAGGHTLVVPADVTDRAAVEEAVGKAVAHFGRLDAVVNNAGFGYFGTVERMSMDDFDVMIKTNVYGLLHVTQTAIPHLKGSRGMIVNISSGLSKRALPFLSAYAGTKSMVDSLSDGLRLELRKHGIKVLNYCPPEVETGFATRSRKEPGLDALAERRPKAGAVDVARHISRAMAAEKREVVSGKSLMIMNFFAPGLVDRIFYKAMVLKMSREG